MAADAAAAASLRQHIIALVGVDPVWLSATATSKAAPSAATKNPGDIDVLLLFSTSLVSSTYIYIDIDPPRPNHTRM